MNELTLKQARAQAFEMEGIMRDAVDSGQYVHINIPVKHTFHGGVYAREITIPQGCVLTGQVHKYDNMNILAKGKILILVDGKPVELEAPTMICSPAGVKRAAFAVTECVWITFLPTNETDPEICERLFIVKTEKEYQQFLALERAQRPACLS